MDNRSRKSFRFRVTLLTLIFVILVTAGSVAAIISIRYYSVQGGIAASQPSTFLLYIFFALLIGLAVFFAFYSVYSIVTRVQKPLNSLEKMANYFANTGNLKLPEKMTAELKNNKNVSHEIDSVTTSFEKLIETLSEKVAVLEAVAMGDLRNRVNQISDEDYLAIAVNDVVTNLNKIVHNVITATEQLSIGAKELSIGAQSMSQSFAVQSATMDKLHITAGEIAEEAAENAERASEAFVLTARIKGDATEGGRKMLDMTTSMSEINRASHSIDFVMKTIDEIAFQTNILALNAAVEAARAGIHGKGFAVVADEVRSLATKSSDAANNTNAMIADTIAKSDMGTKIADEAIAFFKTIEEGIANINELLDEIAKATKSQSLATEQINKSLTDMTNVVYHNSASSQESAAASEQMSDQAIVLKDTVNKFILENDPEPSKTHFTAGPASPTHILVPDNGGGFIDDKSKY